LQTNKNTMANLDCLRIIAACCVVVLHYADYVKDHATGRFMVAHTQHLNLFVDLFFVVSGYVIASQYLGKADAPGAVLRFLWRRLARIYPLHLATLAFYIVIAVALYFGLAKTDNPARYPLHDIPAQLLLLHALDGERLTFNFPSWSLSAEMFCYLGFPIVALFLAPRRRMVVALVCLLMVANTVYASATDTGPWAEWINKGGVFRALPGFSLGIACYLYRNEIARWPAIPGLLVVALVGFAVFGWLLPEMAGLIAVYAIAVLAIQSDSAQRSSLLTRLHLDRGSAYTYSCYMLHIPIATVVLTFGARFADAHAVPGGKLALLPVAVAVLAVASIVSYHFFETPLRRYLNAVFDRNVTRDIPASATLQQERLR
jgi:peptidoglycan/LPS O-acetylase OafA/YrhL